MQKHLSKTEYLQFEASYLDMLKSTLYWDIDLNFKNYSNGLFCFCH